MHVRRLLARKKAGPSTTTSLLAQRKRAGLAAWHASLVLSAIAVGLILITTVFFSQGALAANPNGHSSPLGPSVPWSATIQPPVQYPLVFAPNSPKACELSEFCINATLGFLGKTTLVNSTTTTITAGGATTIVHGSTTTIISGIATTEKLPDVGSSYSAYVTALVQDAVTGQNVTTSSGSSVITDLCYIQPTGFTHCYVVGNVPGEDALKVTVFVTTPDGKTTLAPPSPPVTVAK